MIFPLTHEDMSARRLPLATILIIALCFAVHVATVLGERAAMPRLARAVAAAEQYFDAHPAQKRCPLLERVQPHRPPAQDKVDLFDPDDPGPGAVCAELDEAVRALPAFRWGYVPADGFGVTLLTSQFMHGGWLHLVFNMWFLWLCGCNLEDRWGRHVFVPFYLIAGVVAAIAHGLATPTGWLPLVGASGAIAGAMGAFLVSYARTRIRFFYWVFLRPGTFTAPAYVMLPLWLLTQVLWGLVDAGDGVAYWAHVGGFVFGLGFGIVLRATGMEKKLDDAIEAKVSRVQDHRLVEAGDLINAGRAADAVVLLDKLAVEKPSSVDVQLELARAARALADPARLARAQMRLVDAYVASNMVEAADETWAEIAREELEERLPRAWRAAAADKLAGVGLPHRAEAIWTALLAGGVGDPIAVKVAIARARMLCDRGRFDEARELLVAARASPSCEGELATAAAAVLARVPAS